MASVNKAIIIGHLGRDPELKQGQSALFCNLSVATDESYQDNNGNKISRTEWHRIVVYGKQAENCAKYLKKGSLVYIEGSLQTRKWQDDTGIERYTTEIKASRVQFLDRKDSENKGDNRQSASYDYDKAILPDYETDGVSF